MNEPKICPLIGSECRDVRCEWWEEDACKCIIKGIWDVVLDIEDEVNELVAKV